MPLKQGTREEQNVARNWNGVGRSVSCGSPSPPNSIKQIVQFSVKTHSRAVKFGNWLASRRILLAFLWFFFLIMSCVLCLMFIIQKEVYNYESFHNEEKGSFFHGKVQRNFEHCHQDAGEEIESIAPENAKEKLKIDSSKEKFPVFAYLITGSKNDGSRMKRLLQSIYHPRNEYVLHLDLESSHNERAELLSYLNEDPVFKKYKNVHLVQKSNLVTYRGSTMIAAYLHGAAILIKRNKNWDWFINLSSSDYPLMTQDDLAHAFASISRKWNFVEHEFTRGWNRHQRARPLMVDPSIYSAEKMDLIFPVERRPLPTAFDLFQGSAWVVLSRPFVEYVLLGWDNLPRLALMYFTNFVSSPESYFQTVLCNSCLFRNSTVNTDLRYIKWHTPPRQHPKALTLDNFEDMAASGAPFARKFGKNGPILDRIDKDLLGRCNDCIVPGGWCTGKSVNGSDPCITQGEISVGKVTSGAERLKKKLALHLNPDNLYKKQCHY